MQNIVNKYEKNPKLISLSVDIKNNFLTTKSFSKKRSIIIVVKIINVLIFGLKVLASSHNPTIKKIKKNNRYILNLLIEIKDSKKIKNRVVIIVTNKHIPPINGVGLL